MSLRSLTRAIPRSLTRSIGVATAASQSLRLAKPVVAQPLLARRTAASPLAKYAAFSTSRPAWEEKAGQVDIELAAKFEEELGFEVSPENSQAEVTEYIQSYLKDSPFELKDAEGEDEVVMTRKFGNEDIKLVFSIADLKTLAEEPDLDDSLGDEDFDVEPESSSKPAAQATESSASGNAEDPTERPSYPARVSVTIQKPGSSQGALHVEVLARDGLIQVEDVAYYASPELADAKTAEQGWQRQSVYTGPPFGNLDEELQVLLERYLDERGINEGLATFIPDYMEFKEQREYVRWLKNLRGFVEA
ncbi:hypothetical protein KEM52_002347 [Ascosphaera acerosa]|nr:hypothetical protein KEM52_002347 [Ascosphaera acerosa]